MQKKNFKQIIKINKKLFKKQKYNINYRKLQDNKTQNQREYIAKFFIILNIIFVL